MSAHGLGKRQPLWRGLLEGLRGLLPRLRRHHLPTVTKRVLRAVIDETASARPFTAAAAVDISPTARGVYLLYARGRLVYFGVAENSGIRQELERHLTGAFSARTGSASGWNWLALPLSCALAWSLLS